MRLDEDLLREVKKMAASRGMTLTAVLDEALREMLARRAGAPFSVERPSLPTFDGRGLRPGVDLYDSSALRDLMDRSRDPA